MSKLASDLPNRPAWDIAPPSEEKKREIETLFQQPFCYLSHGAQTFVFTSKDGQYILKIFRQNRWIHPWRKAFRENVLCRKKHLSPERKIERLFFACKVAYDRASDLTGLVYVHLNGSIGELPTIKVRDPLGRSHSIDLNRYRFVVQYRARPQLEEVRAASGNPERLKLLTRSFLQLLEERTRRGIANSDTKVHTNFGFLGDRAIEWDFGNYWLNEELADSAKRQEEIERFALKLGTTR
ncbi:MAG: hypothetical protein KGJ02_06075 [Verrucomicrobiota bacterium]|nr:hypothetical protein [Verrucomicrobiota bacterium]